MNAFYGFSASGYYDLQMNFLLAGVAINVNGAYTTSANLPSITDFTNLFDQYMIDKVDLTFYYSNNTSGVSTPAYSMPIFWIAEDYNSSEASPLTTIQQYSNVKAHYLGESGGAPIRLTIRPKASLQANTSGGTYTGNVVAPGPTWINCDGTAVPHFGVKLAWDTSGRSTNIDVGNINITAKYHLKFRAPK